MEVGPEQRALLEKRGIALYEDALERGGLCCRDPRWEDPDERATLELLVQLGLLVRDTATDTWLATDPSTPTSQVVGPLGQQGAALLAESAAWAEDLASLSLAWRSAPQRASGPITELHRDQIDPFIASLVADCQDELLTAQPQVGRNPTALARATERDVRALERGVSMKTLYQHAARRNSATHSYVTTVTEAGAEIRTLDEFFNRLIVIDRKTAIIPGKHGHSVALAIREASLVAYLVDMFERHWERARPFVITNQPMMKDVASQQRGMAIRMLIAGHSDPNSAKRLGVSPRTYAAYVADLKHEHEAETRFQLGYAMGQRGISGDEHTHAQDE